MTASVSARHIHDGWIIVAALSVAEAVTWGIVDCGFPVFLRPMVALGSHVGVCWALSASLLLAGVLVLLVGWGPRVAA